MTPQLKYTSLLWLPSSYKLVNYDSLELIFPRKFWLPLVYNDSPNFSRARMPICLILHIPEKSKAAWRLSKLWDEIGYACSSCSLSKHPGVLDSKIDKNFLYGFFFVHSYQFFKDKSQNKLLYLFIVFENI